MRVPRAAPHPGAVRTFFGAVRTFFGAVRLFPR
jgi:hypothetical protein